MTRHFAFDAEERELLADVEAGAWVAADASVQASLRANLGLAQRKDARINVRLSSQDLTGLQLCAARAGIPYQTLLASLVHQYVTGQLRSVSGIC